MSRHFPARYPGKCPACGDAIDTGDLLTYDEDDVVVHSECASRAPEQTRRPVVICPSCYLAKPCGCEDVR